jgi:hypothetical protein
LLFFGTGRRKKRDDGLWWDIYHDPIIDSVDKPCLLWERPYNVTHFTPPKTSNMKYVDIVEYTGTLLQKLGISKVSFTEEETSFFKEIEDEIASRFGTEIDLKSMVKEDLSKRKASLPIYRRLIRKVDPEVALLTVSYNGRETFVEACQIENVPVIELQHGVINKYHMGYSFPHGNKKVFPDYFFSFGDFWSDYVDLPLTKSNIYSVGYPYLESESKKYEDIKAKNQTLFISQPNIGNALSRFAVELNEHVAHEQEIIYKFHPNEPNSWKDKYPWLKKSDITCITDEIPLYQLFAESTSQIGVNSTALYEGLRFGLDTYVVDFPGYEYMQYLIDNDHAIFIQSVEGYLEKRKSNTSQVDVEYFFESDSITRFESAIEEIT